MRTSNILKNVVSNLNIKLKVEDYLLDEYNKDKITSFKSLCKWIPLFVASFVNFLFLISDYILIPHLIWKVFTLRLIISGLGIIIYFLAKKIDSIFWFEVMFFIWLSLSAWIITIIIFMAGGASSPYTGGLNIVVLTMLVFFSVSKITQIFGIISSWLPYYYLFFYYPMPESGTKIVIIYTFINSGTIILGLLLQHLKHKNHLSELQLRYELKKEREKSDELSKLKSRFFTNISHEFRTPLTLILGPVNSLLKKEFDSETQNELIILQRNSDRLLKLINELLDFSKIETHSLTIHLKPVRIIHFTRYCISLFDSFAKEKNIKIYFSAQGLEQLIMHVDIDKYEKIINNLLSNAMKFTPFNGEIKVICTINEKHFVFKVIDNGKGIPTDKLGKIFNLFFHIEDTTYPQYEGTGIGLALTKELIQLHNGTIDVTSKVDIGTELTVRLPLAESNIKESEPPILKPLSYAQELSDLDLIPHADVQNLVNENAPTILIIEDNNDMRTYLTNCLQEKYTVIKAINGEQGLELANKFQPDLIISDVMMPQMNGITFCNTLKKTEQISHIPIILLTAKVSQESKITGLKNGADDYLFKPFDTEELLVRVENLIKQRELLKLKFQQAPYNLDPKSVTITSVDEKFLKKAMEILEKHMNNSKFETTIFSQEMGVSRSNLNIKLKALTGFSTRMFIRQLRLKRAAQLLSKQAGNVSEVSYLVGFESLSHFTKAFKEQFGVTPSKYKHEIVI